MNYKNAPDVTLKILKNRGITSEEEQREFLNPLEGEENDAWLFSEMLEGVKLIKAAIESQDLITIWGDYDVDGMVGTSILLRSLREAGANVNFRVALREEGYGLNKEGLKDLADAGTKLLITVDNGIAANEEISYAKDLGMDVILTDHHEPAMIEVGGNLVEDLPPADVVLNPKVEGERYPFKEICGATVAYKLSTAIAGKGFTEQFKQLVAFATVADVVPLVDENRVLVAQGVKQMAETPLPSIQTLEKVIRDNEKWKNEAPVTTETFGFRYGPFLNSAGRLGDASLGIKLLSSDDANERLAAAKEIFALNEKRTDLQKSMLLEARTAIQEGSAHSSPDDKAIVLVPEAHWGWKAGLTGIVAGNISQMFEKPTITFTEAEPGLYTGSARSFGRVNLFEIISELKDLTESFGGHEMAAGLSVKEENLDAFAAKFLEKINSLDESYFEVEAEAELDLDVTNVDSQLINSLALLEPFGQGNPKPVIRLKDTYIEDVVLMGEGAHYRCKLSDGYADIKGIAFNSAAPKIGKGDVYGEVGFNYFAGSIIPQFTISVITEVDDEDTSFQGTPGSVPLTEVLAHKGTANRLKEHKVETTIDLLNFFPLRYFDFSKAMPIAQAEVESTQIVFGQVTRKKQSAAGFSIYVLNEFNEEVRVYWWGRNHYLQPRIKVGDTGAFVGTVKDFRGKYLECTDMFSLGHNAFKEGITTEYKKLKGISDKNLRGVINQVAYDFEDVDFLDPETLRAFDLVTLKDMFMKGHYPESVEDVRDSMKRRLFNDLFLFSVKVNANQYRGEGYNHFKMRDDSVFAQLDESLPFELTEDQKNAIKDFSFIMSSDNVLDGLLEGDVGSGKTMVAAYLLALSSKNGYQGMLMAPTDILAKQHYEELVELLSPLGINVRLLTGSLKAKEQREVIDGIKSQDIDIVVGTTSLVQKRVEIENIGLVVVDEEHKFGVEQQDFHLKQERMPHRLLMSATPIPRTLATALLSDTVTQAQLIEKPAGRKPIKSARLDTINSAYSLIEKEIAKGHQAYVVCPLITSSESEIMDGVANVEDTYKQLIEDGIAKEGEIAMLTGNTPKEEEEEIMKGLVNNEIKILVSTTVVEVGVNIPNATVMIIRSSYRFGLAQAHQLRGRVGRGDAQSYCIFEDDTRNWKTDVLVKYNDGFKIAEEDTEMRGMGNLIGTEQTGDFRMVRYIIENPKHYGVVNNYVRRFIREDRKKREYYFSVIDELLNQKKD